VPGDECSEQITVHGVDLLTTARDGGVVVLLAGISYPDETLHGRFDFPEDNSVQPVVCDALGWYAPRASTIHGRGPALF
jgi:hypothetical protein